MYIMYIFVWLVADADTILSSLHSFYYNRYGVIEINMQ